MAEDKKWPGSSNPALMEDMDCVSPPSDNWTPPDGWPESLKQACASKRADKAKKEGEA